MNQNSPVETMKRIAVLEDDLFQARTIEKWLTQAGYETEVRHDGDSLIALVGEARFDMLLLDWDVPGKNGNQVLREMRARFGHEFPIVMVTQHDDDRDIVRGLQDGADDYIVKPVKEAVLLARVAAQIRSYHADQQAAAGPSVWGYALEPASLSVTLPTGKTVTLPTREFDLATCLFEQPGRVVSKDVLFRRLWGTAEGGDSVTLATYISRLRSILELRREKSGIEIATVYGHGYRLQRADTE
ncbi:two-component system response regulator [Burkholderia ubonensis]|uniref:response regulator transcription factor n=1 Tax=Burkholderia ubonensis TaxID=101571 RepID=UPI00075B522E|nr:response regulator transcription factor [Burkholderia ubonensis]KVO87649.1 two-component system response regulator [Burkholderia ubonensis]KVZ57266.1 two-component system response regulator [Burkholderia ubonensis]KVZ72964.1 two-component system response regulator [Burkholderia ubonensis]